MMMASRTRRIRAESLTAATCCLKSILRNASYRLTPSADPSASPPLDSTWTSGQSWCLCKSLFTGGCRETVPDLVMAPSLEIVKSGALSGSHCDISTLYSLTSTSGRQFHVPLHAFRPTVRSLAPTLRMIDEYCYWTAGRERPQSRHCRISAPRLNRLRSSCAPERGY